MPAFPCSAVTALGLAALLALTAGCNERAAPLPHPTAAQPCPQWTLFPSDRHSNLDSPYLGCSTTANLRAMVADPADLEQGRPLGPADGERQARAIEAYRQGKVKSSGAAGASAPVPVPSGPSTPGGS